MHFESSLTVNAPLENVYAAFTDFESMPKWSKQVTTIRVVRKGADAVYLEAESVLGGRRRIVSREMRLFPPGRVESEGKTRFTRTKRTVTFEEVPSGTKVTATLDVRVRGLWSLVLTAPGSESAETSVADELSSFGRYVEGLPQSETLDSA